MTDSGSLTPRGPTANKGEPAAAFKTRPHNHPQQSAACSERVEICRAASSRADELCEGEVFVRAPSQRADIRSVGI